MKIVEAIRSDLLEVKEGLAEANTKLDNIASGDIAPSARGMAEKLTVSAMPDRHRRAIGHGLLVKLAGHGDDEIFFVSAAHVVAHIEPKQGVTFSLSNGISAEGEFTEKMYIPMSYIKDGTVDIGVVEVSIPGLRSEAVKVPVSKKDDCIGKVVVGKGNVLIRGEAVGVVENNNTRILVNAISIEGSSGAPLFDNIPSLALALHGESRHRRHRYEFGGVTPHSANLFADAFEQARFDQIKFTDDNYADLSKVLKAIEDIEQEVLDDTKHEYVGGGSFYASLFPKSIGALLDCLRSLDQEAVDALAVEGFTIESLLDFAASKLFKTPESEEGKVGVEAPRGTFLSAWWCA
eukprot:scaffold8126_cov170-Amphora_coffeaeformis.AAC.18